ncbi:hypothetical protein EUGRSUZ_D02259 [Eucalyptus grandis]|uniref:(+)-neomenthol dehydrogenase-like n=1 Tax=Eucalyptus grandis TaxID=71139 RepID=A0A059CIP5_EUCGR|nr:hypothetical protein EUGRSUZ_D02259 [Eucalyptus grandis]
MSFCTLMWLDKYKNNIVLLLTKSKCLVASPFSTVDSFSVATVCNQMAESTKRYAVVTGANKGIGFEICRQLASSGIVVVLTSRDEKRGLEAVQKLKDSGLSDYIIFHQLDVTNLSSVLSLANFIETQFRKLDILVNNAGVIGATINEEAFRASNYLKEQDAAKVDWSKILVPSYEAAEVCIDTNYYGAKRMVEAHISLLQRSDSPRIVNVSSIIGKLQTRARSRIKAVSQCMCQANAPRKF